MSGAKNPKTGEWRKFRQWIKRTVNIILRGGPWNGGRSESDSLDPIKLVFDGDKRQVYVYYREDGLEYLYSPAMSEAATEDYDETLRVWGQTSYQVVTG